MLHRTGGGDGLRKASTAVGVLVYNRTVRRTQKTGRLGLTEQVDYRAERRADMVM